MTKFEENGVQKQEQAYQIGYANKMFTYSCTMCAGRNLDCHKHGCDNCPISIAHSRAIQEITEGKRKPNERVHYGASKHYYNGRTTTVMYNFNITVNINTKENNK